MKRTLKLENPPRLTGYVLAAVGWLLAPAHATTIGLNFSDDWGSGGGAAVTEDAFGIPVANWYNLPRIFNSESGSGVSASTTITLPEGGSLDLEWSCNNTYSLPADPPTSGGDDEAIYGYLDDGGSGYRVRISGFRNTASAYAITLIASTDSGDGFMDAVVASGSVTNVLQYADIQTPSYASGAFSVSSSSSVISTLATNNAVVLTGTPRTGQTRSTLAAIQIDYTPGGNNPPLVEVQPEAPTETIYDGSPFSLSVVVSGSSTLAYQWRKGGIPVGAAGGPVYTKGVAIPGDSGDYDVIASNTYGSVTSRVATVTITPIVQPLITKGPVSQSLYAGYPAKFSVEATGGQLVYQWKKGETMIPNATNSTLLIPSISGNDEGLYTISVSNSKGAVSSSAAVTLVAPTSPYASVVAASKPMVYFRMSEPGPVAQATATNRGSLGGPGTGLYIGAYSVPVEGALVGSSDTAVALTGGRVSVGYDAALNPPGSFTVECWAKPIDTVVARRVMVQSMINGELPDNAADRSGWSFRQNGPDLEFVIGGSDGAPSYTTTLTATGAVTAGVWNHYAAVYNGETLNVSLLVNGVEVTNVTADAAILVNTAAPLLVGDRGYGGWTFLGSLDEVALYPSLLTSAQLLVHYQSGTNAATSTNYPALVVGDGAVEYLRLDDAGLSPTANAATNNGTWGADWTGSYVGAGATLGDPLIAAGMIGPQPAAFPGFETSNTAVSMTNGWVTSPPLVLGNQVTAICWLNREEISTTGDLSWPAWLGGGGLHLNNGNAAIPEAELRYHWNGEKWDWASGLFVPPNVWTLAALVVEPEQATIYMSDGTTLLSSTNTTPHAPMIVTSPPGFGGNQPGRADRNYIGQLDEVAVYDRALTGAEINTIFTGAFSKGPVPPSALALTLVNGDYMLSWTLGVLQMSSTLGGQFADVPGATSPYPMVPTAGQNFYRLRGAE